LQIGLYIHIPFCVSKCPYCDFNSVDGADQATMGRYLDALCAEVDALSQLPAVRDRAISTVFVGGGTPTIYGGDALGRLLEAGRQSLSIDPGAEITVEANPGTVSQEKLCRLRDAGYNRLSIGVQSLQARILERLGRKHSVEQGIAAVQNARVAGFENINVDMIHSVPGQSVKEWCEDLRQVVSLVPQHVSAYSLTIEAETQFGKWSRGGSLTAVAEETDAIMFEKTHCVLTEHGYQHYEISNYAVAGRECRHNLLYWNNEDWLAVGAGAHQHLDGERRWNVKSPDKYTTDIETKRDAVEGSERVSLSQRMGETMMLGLRKAQGVSMRDFGDRFGNYPMEVFRKEIDRLSLSGLVAVSEDRLALTPKGFRLANIAMMEFIN